MKKLLFLSSLLSMAVFLFIACGDSRPDDLPVSKNATVSKSYEIRASAGSSSELEVKFTIDDFTAIKESELLTSTRLYCRGFVAKR